MLSGTRVERGSGFACLTVLLGMGALAVVALLYAAASYDGSCVTLSAVVPGQTCSFV